MGVKELLAGRRGRILKTAARHGARNVRVFGSVAMGRATKASDVDFLVDMRKGKTLLDLVGLAQDLEAILNKKVDVVSSRGLSPYLRRSIVSHAIPL